MEKQTFVSLFCIILGFFCAISAGLNLDFFMNHRKAKKFIKFFGRDGTRIFYIVIGIVFIGVGIGFFTGAISLEGKSLIGQYFKNL